jgi:branched-chain amino acid transport system permease protein
LTLLVAGAAVAVAFAIQHTRFGWALAAVRDAEDVAEGLGVATFRYKLQALVASAVIGGVGGSIFALQIGFVAVDSVFHLTVPLFVIVMSVLGGRTHWLGPVLGAAVIVLLQNRITVSGLGDWQLIVLGTVLAALVVLAPDGLYARLRARPWVVLLAFVTVVAVTLPWLDILDALLVSTVAAVVVAMVPWPRSARHTPAPAAPPVPAARPASDEPPPTGDVLVDCHGLARSFGGVRALEGVTFQVREGELVGLVGPNGSGKTTLVSLLSGALRPTRGSISIAGVETGGLPPHRVAHVGVARTYQIPRPFGSMTVRDNVAMALMFGRAPRPLAQARRDAERHLAMVGLGARADARPAGLNLHQRQLLEVARALATEPKVLLLDEALAGLNPAEIDNAVRVIRRVHASGITIVIVEHLLRVVNQLATRIVVLDRGSILADGEPRTVMTDPAVVQAYLGKRAHA